MDNGLVILIIGLAALVAAVLLLVIGLVYSELVNSHIPRGVGSCGKLHVVHALFVGLAVVVSFLLEPTGPFALSFTFFFVWFCGTSEQTFTCS